MPPSPVLAKFGAECDCISVFQPNTKWRLNYRGSEIYEGLNYFSFNIFTVANCSEVTFRDGYCCESTLDSIEIALDSMYNDDYWRLVKYYWLIDVDNTIILNGTIGTAQRAPAFGLIFTGFFKEASQVPPGTEMKLVLALDPFMWSNTQVFPCGQSQLVETPGLCDYQLHGLQFRDGQILLANGNLPLAACCPEGIYKVQNPEQFCGCNDNKLDSPFRLSVQAPTSTSDYVQYNYRISSTLVTGQIDPIADVSCANMDLDRIRIYIRSQFYGAVNAISLNGSPVAVYQYGDNGLQFWIELMNLDLPPSAPGTAMQLSFSVPTYVTAPSLCPPNAMGTPECEYVFYGNWNITQLDFDCCAHGFSDTDAVLAELPPVTCDTDHLHSPYSLAFSQIFYGTDMASGTTISYAEFSVTYNPAGCDVADPSNTCGCCSSDLKAVYLQLPSVNVTSVSSTPPVQGFTYHSSAMGLNITGVFGRGASYLLSVTMVGTQTANTVCPYTSLNDGCRYRMYGGMSLMAPGACCATSVTGLIP